MSVKFLDKTGVAYLWGKIKAAFVKKSGDTMTGNLTLKGAQLYFVNGSNVNQFRIQSAYNRFYLQTYLAGGNSYTNFRLPLCLDDGQTYDILCTAPTSPYYYQAGDTFAAASAASLRLLLNGIVTSNRKTLYVNVPLDKPLGAVSSITVTTLTGWAYGVAGAIEGSTTGTDWTDGYTLTAGRSSDRNVRIAITRNDNAVFGNTTASTPIIMSAHIVLTFM